MSTLEETITTSYGFSVPSIELGHVLHEARVHPDLSIKVPLSMMNRHGLIAGSTGTGKTRTLQLLAEGLSKHGVPTFLADVKGDLAGMAIPGVANQKIIDRLASVNRTFEPESSPVEFFSLTGTRGTQLRATISSFGPVLLGKVLDLTEVQQSVLAMVFKFCDDRQMPLLDFKDLRDVLNYLGDEGKAELRDYGGISAATIGVLIRKMVELEQQGAGKFFGEPELDIQDLIRTNENGRGIVNILSLADVQDKPRLYSTFLMWLLGQFYYGLPEVGDPEKPKLVFFFDEAHLLFDDASSALVEHIEQVSRLIRSKGIGVFFITQTPKDVNENVLAQLGNRVQHAVRAFTPNDAKNLKATASTFPESAFYEISETLTALGTGEALITVLNPRGIPTAVCAAQMMAPRSSMGALDDQQFAEVYQRSALSTKYSTPFDRDSAHEMIQRKLAAAAEAGDAATDERERAAAQRDETPAAPRRTARPQKTMVEKVLASSAARQATRTVVQQVIRGIFGMLKR